MAQACTLVQSFAMLGSAFFAGGSCGLSLYGICIVRSAPSVALKLQQFKVMHKRGHYSIPTTIIPLGLVHLVLAGLEKVSGGFGVSARLEALAGVLCVVIAPFTILLIEPQDQVLLALAEVDEGTAKEKYSVAQLDQIFDRWAVLNYIRCGMPLASAVVGLVSLFSRF